MRQQRLARLHRRIPLRRTEQFRDPLRREPLRVRQARLQRVDKEVSRRIQRLHLPTIRPPATPEQIPQPTPLTALPLRTPAAQCRMARPTLQTELLARPLQPSRKQRRSLRCNFGRRNRGAGLKRGPHAILRDTCPIRNRTYASLLHSRNQQASLTTHLTCGHRYECAPRRFIRLNSEVIP
jgi:hypothetical protein